MHAEKHKSRAPSHKSRACLELGRTVAGRGSRVAPVLCFLCLLCFPASSSATTVTGTINDASGAPLASGQLILRLSQEGTVADPALLLIQPPVTCTITSGAIGSCSVKGNDTISPAGTFYKVRVISDAGQELLPERRYTITGTTWDIGTATPLATETVAAQAYQIVQDEGTNLAQRQTLNFTGAGVACTDDSANARTNCSLTGGGGGGATHQVDGVNLTAQDPINLQDTAEIDVTNPSAGDLQLALKTASIADSKLSSNYSGVGNCAASQWVTGLNDNAAPTCGQPAFSDLSGAATDAQVPDTITLTNLTQIATRNYSDLQNRAHTLVGSDHTAGGLAAGQVVRATGATTFAWQAIQPADLGSGFLDAPTDISSTLCGTNEILEDQGASWACIPTPTGGGGNHNLLSATHPDTTTATVVRGDLVVGQSATPSWQRLALGAANQVLASDGTDAAWTPLAKAHLPSTTVHTDQENIFTATGALTMDNQAALRLREASVNGTNYVEHRSTASLAANSTYTWSAAAAGFLRSDPSGNLSLNAASGTGSCTNQFPRTLNDNAAPTCADVAPADFASQTANTFLAAPDGAAGEPMFRAIVDGDIPAGLSRDTETPAAGDISGSLSAGYSISAGAVASAELAAAHKTFVEPFRLFDSTGLQDSDDFPSFFRAPAAITITEVWCETDAGSPSINIQRDDGTPANVLSANLTCTTTGATGTINAAEDNLAANERLDFVMVTASTAKRISLMVKYTVD